MTHFSQMCVRLDLKKSTEGPFIEANTKSHQVTPYGCKIGVSHFFGRLGVRMRMRSAARQDGANI